MGPRKDQRAPALSESAVRDRDRPVAPRFHPLFRAAFHRKGLTDLLQAMQWIPDIKLQIAGEGPQRAELENLARDLNLANVEFIGQISQPELNTLISSSRFTVLPSRAYETLGKTILESYACGRAVVASDLGSRRELVRQNETGVLYPAGDIAQLARSISFLVAHPELSEKMGAAGRALVAKQHSPENHYVALSGLYDRMMQRSEKIVRPEIKSVTKTGVRVAFIGGRGVISKYSGSQTDWMKKSASGWPTWGMT